MNQATHLTLFLFLAAACGGANTTVETSRNESAPTPAVEAVGDEAASSEAASSEATSSVATPAAPSCPNAQPIPPCEDEVEATVSATDVLNQWDSLEGQTVHVLGPLRVDHGMCTEQECPPEEPCCNSCGGQLTISVGDVILDDPAGRFSCQGTGCGLCCGYEVSNRVVRTSGRLGIDRHGYRHLHDAVVCVPSGS